MYFKNKLKLVFLVIAAAAVISSCSGTRDDLLLLDTFTKNSVTVSIYLDRPKDGTSLLLASFVPEAGLHLYSKEIPRNGVDGLGRPTLLELTPASKMTAAGELTESIPAQIPAFEPKELLVYPVGMVTLTLPVTLPDGNGQMDDEISITYIACSDTGCKAPVVNQILVVHLPIQ